MHAGNHQHKEHSSMHAHHERVIERLVAQFEGDLRYPVLLIGGSIAKGRAKPESDVDVFLVATEEEFARRLRDVDVYYRDEEIADYPGGYVDGKVISHQFLLDAADHGSEPTRNAFANVLVAYSRLPDLGDLLARVVAYPEHERTEKMRRFYIQLATACFWFMPEAEQRRDLYFRSWAATTAAFYACRLILAHNRILYPWQKWLLHEVRRALDKPVDVVGLVEALVADPNSERAKAVYDSITAFADWGLDMGDSANDSYLVSRFILDIEWTWRDGLPLLQEW